MINEIIPVVGVEYARLLYGFNVIGDYSYETIQI